MTDAPDEPEEEAPPPPPAPVSAPPAPPPATPVSPQEVEQGAAASPEPPAPTSPAEHTTLPGGVQEGPPAQQSPTPPPPPPVVQPRPAPLPNQPAAPSGIAWAPILGVLGLVFVLVLAAFAWQAFSNRAPQEEAFVVQPFTPASELITARDRVEARAEPDGSSRVVVIFGQGVTLNVSGRVQRGLGNDWYAIDWNDQAAFVRVQDVTAGSGAPPAPIVRERPPPEEQKEKEKPDELRDEEERAATERRPSGGALGIGEVNWIREPNARDFARYFPDRALDSGQSGNVTLSCIIGGGGRLACSVASESPPGYGFGRAAINISRQLRVHTTLPDGSSAEGREMRLPLSFRAG